MNRFFQFMYQKNAGAMGWGRSCLYAILLAIFMIAGCVNPANDSTNTTPTPTSFTVSFNAGDGATGTALINTDIKVGTRVPLPEPTGLTKPGYIFVGWKNGTTIYQPGAYFELINGENTFTAVWKQVFISVWKTTSPDQVITLPLVQDGEYDFTVDWGDNSTDDITTATASHTYTAAGTYTITIAGKIKGWSFESVPTSKDAIHEIQYWGPLDFGETHGQFKECSNLTITATDAPTLSGPSLLSAFQGASSLKTIPGAANWDVSNVTDMSLMFRKATVFNQDISNWDVSNVTSMDDMFYRATAFNGDISGWDVSNVTRMSYMFYWATTFNGDISGWDVGKVYHMGGMFYKATEFNQNISGWEVSAVSLMQYMFYGAAKFNQDLSAWNDKLGKVTDMEGMFGEAAIFNQDLSGWVVKDGVKHTDMFKDSPMASLTSKHPKFNP